MGSRCHSRHSVTATVQCRVWVLFMSCESHHRCSVCWSCDESNPTACDASKLTGQLHHQHQRHQQGMNGRKKRKRRRGLVRRALLGPATRLTEPHGHRLAAAAAVDVVVVAAGAADCAVRARCASSRRCATWSALSDHYAPVLRRRPPFTVHECRVQTEGTATPKSAPYRTVPYRAPPLSQYSYCYKQATKASNTASQSMPAISTLTNSTQPRARHQSSTCRRRMPLHSGSCERTGRTRIAGAMTMWWRCWLLLLLL